MDWLTVIWWGLLVAQVALIVIIGRDCVVAWRELRRLRRLNGKR